MITYKTSDLFRRAKQLADLEGTDFITWNEAINCINESYIGLYEKLINMGDNSFVESFHTKEKEIELPSDFWQLKGVFLWNNGNLQTINRRADNNGIHHLSYEMRNGKIFIFGNPNEILIEYYKKPKTLYMPKPDMEIDLSGLPEGAEIKGVTGHKFVYKKNGEIGIYDLDGQYTATNIFSGKSVDEIYVNTNCVIATFNDDTKAIYNITNFSKLDIEDSNTFILIQNDTIYQLAIMGDAWLVRKVFPNLQYLPSEIINTEDFTDWVTDITPDIIYVDNNMKPLISVLNHTLLSKKKPIYISQTGSINSLVQKNNLIYVLTEIFGLFDVTKGKEIVISGFETVFIDLNIINPNARLPIGISGINETTGYGFVTQNAGTDKYYVKSWCEDTVLDFPNSFYYQMLSYLLAISFRCKQGADITLLSKQLDMISQTFEDTLGSDNFQFPRMGNVYN